ncbi:MAG: alpha-glucan family phosphorylase [Bacteroidales bacterium]|nr:alpha-glucan family phosphorylase [Bacteroidales bacterium]MCF8387191.1 alpha-glucan family phosphorylase [Bacteroidales bacterium]MCF8396924.1 alpha-glucan family phosphorylase [Bacteroidales bacterium]
MIDYQPTNNTYPDWKKVLVKPIIPEKLKGLFILSKNLWWSWNPDVKEVFRSINPELWKESEQNPVSMLEKLNLDQLKDLENDAGLMERIERIYQAFEDYMGKVYEKPSEQIAYFSMEFGLHESLRTYSGGLGILAGDYLKEASDQNRNMVGVGLLYRYGYFQQSLSAYGEQIASYIPQRFNHLPLNPVRDENGTWIKVDVELPGRTIYAKVWRVDVGRTPLFLMDTDIPDNSEEDRAITHKLYGGDSEHRLKQEILLGIGGIKMLDELKLKPVLFHSNEGHSAFIGVERLRKLINEENYSFEDAVEFVRSSTLFTTHTPVPAGHDYFSHDLVKTYLGDYIQNLKISFEEFIELGRLAGSHFENSFSMSVLALKLSQEINGVSKIHGRVSRQMFSTLYPEYFDEELNIGYVTNGVHFESWAASESAALYKKMLGSMDQLRNPKMKQWSAMQNLDNKDIWELRRRLKSRLFTFLRESIERDMMHRQENPKIIFKTLENLHEGALTIGFARRFATYKRAGLLFSNLERLAQIINDEDQPVIFIFSGKAHPNDEAGQALIRRIIEISKKPEFIGRIIFIENYNIAVARKLVQGVDLWLNTPTRPMEASGTSGQKAALNGVLNLSVLDGWWAEGYKPGAGWMIKEEKTYEDQHFQDELDAESIYNILENEIIPTYFERDDNSIPNPWVDTIKNNMEWISPQFTMTRMMNDYFEQYYHPLMERHRFLLQNNRIASFTSWKRKIKRNWSRIALEEARIPDPTKEPLNLGENFRADLQIKAPGLSEKDLGVEVIFGQKENDQIEKIVIRHELSFVEKKEGNYLFRCEFPLINTGVWDYAFRIYPQNELMHHRLDLPLIKYF